MWIMGNGQALDQLGNLSTLVAMITEWGDNESLENALSS